MTTKKVLNTLQLVKQCKEQECFMEALIIAYQSCTLLLKDIGKKVVTETGDPIKKPKAILKVILQMADTDERLKKLLGKKSLKTLKPWYEKMDVFFDTIKQQNPRNTKTLLEEAEYALNILHITHQRVLGNMK
jgi:hypothetical protein